MLITIFRLTIFYKKQRIKKGSDFSLGQERFHSCPGEGKAVIPPANVFFEARISSMKNRFQKRRAVTKKQEVTKKSLHYYVAKLITVLINVVIK